MSTKTSSKKKYSDNDKGMPQNGGPMSQHKYGPHETDAQWYARNNGKVRGK